MLVHESGRSRRSSGHTSSSSSSRRRKKQRRTSTVVAVARRLRACSTRKFLALGVAALTLLALALHNELRRNLGVLATAPSAQQQPLQLSLANTSTSAVVVVVRKTVPSQRSGAATKTAPKSTVNANAKKKKKMKKTALIGSLHAHECGAEFLRHQRNVSIIADAPMRKDAAVGRRFEFQLRNVGGGTLDAATLHFHVRAVGPSIVVGSAVPWCNAEPQEGGRRQRRLLLRSTTNRSFTTLRLSNTNRSNVSNATAAANRTAPIILPPRAPACWTVGVTLHDPGAYAIEVIPTWLNGELYAPVDECVTMPGHQFIGTHVDFWLYNRTTKYNAWTSCCNWCQLHPQCAYWVAGRKVLAKLVDDKREAIKWGTCTLLKDLKKIMGIERSRYDATLYVSGTRRKGDARQHYIGGLSYGTHDESKAQGKRSEGEARSSVTTLKQRNARTCRARARIEGSPFGVRCSATGGGIKTLTDASPLSRNELSAKHRALPLCSVHDLAAEGRWLPLLATPDEAPDHGGEAWWVERLNARAVLRKGHWKLHGVAPPLERLRLPAHSATAFAWAPLRCRLRYFDAVLAKRCVEQGSVGWAAWTAGVAIPTHPPPPYDAVILGDPFARAEWMRTFAHFAPPPKFSSRDGATSSTTTNLTTTLEGLADRVEAQMYPNGVKDLNATRLRALIVVDGFARVMEGAESSVAEFELSTAAMLHELRNLTSSLHPTSRLLYVGCCGIHEFPGKPYRGTPRFIEFNNAAQRAIAADRMEREKAATASWHYVNAMPLSLARPDFRVQIERNGGRDATVGGVAFSIATAILNGACNPL